MAMATPDTARYEMKDSESGKPLIGDNPQVQILYPDKAKFDLEVSPTNGVDSDVEKALKPHETPPDQQVGLSKEEVERYLNDPFWRKLRLALFVLFWLLWIAMFVIAIILVIISPKCPPKPLRHWWQKKLCYQTYTRGFKDSDDDGIGDFKGISSKVKDLKRISVQTVWPSSVLNSEDRMGYAVTDFKDVHPKLGTIDDFTDLINAVHGNNMFMVMDFPISYTSDKHQWFAESKEGSKRDYYYWGTGSGDSWSTDPSVTDGQSYRHWPGRKEVPVLNLANDKVLEEIKNSLQFWIEKGVDGFYVPIRHLAFKDDASDDMDVEKGQNILQALMETAKSSSDKEIMIFTSLDHADLPQLDDAQIESLKGDLVTKGNLSMVVNTELQNIGSTCYAGNTCADQLYESISKALAFHKDSEETWPMWEMGGITKSRLATRFGGKKEYSELLTMLLLMLPGSVNTYYGDELGMVDVTPDLVGDAITGDKTKYVMRSPMQWNADKNAGFSNAEPGLLDVQVHPDYKDTNFEMQYKSTNSPLRLYKRIGGLRQRDDTFLYGNMTLGTQNSTVLTFARYPLIQSSAYFVALNFGDTKVAVNFNQVSLPPKKGDASVVEMTTNMDDEGSYEIRGPIDISNVELLPRGGIVIKIK